MIYQIMATAFALLIVFFDNNVLAQATSAAMADTSVTIEQKLEILWGVFFIVTGLSMFFQRKYWIEYADALVGNALYLMLMCIVLLLPALTIILWHNVWAWNLSVILTILGWYMTIGYAIIAIVPQLILPIYKQITFSHREAWVIGKGIGLVIIGVLLVLAGCAFM